MFKRKSFREMDLTTGNLFWKVPLFALPMALTTILQLLYTTVDLYTVSNFGGGSNSMSAVGSNGALINLIVALFVSMAIGANVVLAASKGAHDQERAQKTLHTSLIFATFLGLIVGVLGFFLAPLLLKAMGTIDAIIDKASTYLRIYFLGAPFLLIYNFGSQLLRAMGDSQRPLYILIISGLINVAADLIFVILCRMDVAGVALATIISEAISAILTVLWLWKNKKGYVHIVWKQMRVDSNVLSDIVRIGLPAGIQAMGFNIPNVLIQSSLYTITDYAINGVAIAQEEIVAGSSASSQIEGYIFAFIDAFAMACVSFVGQNYGARKINNMKKVYLYCNVWMSIAWGICAIIIAIIPYQILGIFITEGEGIVRENALAAGKERLWLMGFTYILDGFMGIAGSYLRGMKRSTAPALITLLGVTGSRILFLTTLFHLDYFHTIFWLYFAYPMSWVIVDLIYIPTILLIQKKVFAQIRESTPLTGQTETEVN